MPLQHAVVECSSPPPYSLYTTALPVPPISFPHSSLSLPPPPCPSAQFASFSDQIVRLSFHGSGNGQLKLKSLSISSEFGSLKRMMPLSVAIPTLSNLALHDPDGRGVACSSSSGRSASSSAGAIVTICGIEDEVDVLQSLQKPKKVSRAWCSIVRSSRMFLSAS